MGDASEVRRRSWETRRAKYGERGHAGSYARHRNYHGRRALAWIIQMHRDAVLSEGQCCTALDMDRVNFRRLVDEATHD